VERIEMSASIGAFIVQAAALRGVAPAELQRATGFDVAAGQDPDARISIEVEQALWEEAARRSGDDAFGLHSAESLRPGAFDVLDYAVRTAPTLRAALDRLVRYNRLIHDAAVFSVVARGKSARIEHDFATGGAVQCRHSAEFTLGAVVVVSRQVTGAPIRPKAVEFRHGRPTSPGTLAEHIRLFGVQPSFANRVNAVEIAGDELDRVLPAADPALSKLIERHAEALLAALPQPSQGAADRVRHVLAAALGQGDATLATAAAKLKMSERSLQRKLADEGVTFDAMLDELRRDLALRYLADPKIAVSEVAYLLGYSEPSPFHRAFKRWTGVTPSEARRRAA
jgi:AraC-like DNA-binding protein